MGFGRWLRTRFTAPASQTFSESAPKPIDVLFAEMLGRTSNAPVSRVDALSVPAVQRGRNLICSISTLPLIERDSTGSTVRSPLLEQLDPDVPNVVTLAQTVEDLIFDGISWWRKTGRDFANFPVAVRHLDVNSVSLDPPTGRTPQPLPSGVDPRHAGFVWIDGVQTPATEVIRFDSPNPPVRKVAGRAIRRAILLDQAAQVYAEDPRPLDYFSPAESADTIDDDEIRDMLVQWRAARKRRATGYVPAALKYNQVSAPTPQELQLVELQKQVWIELANALGIDPEELGVSTTSRTYANVIDRRRDKINDVLSPYMLAITQRLSMGDVTRRGHRVDFDLDDYLRSNPTERWSVYKIQKELGVITNDEIRDEERMGPMPADAEPEEVPPVPQGAEASARAGYTFDRDLTFVDVPVESFAVDREQRVIEGLLLPYGRVAKGIRFERGALRWTDPARVKLLRDHDPRQPLGKAISLSESHAGLKARFKLGRTPAADEALQLAEDGVLDGLSVGVDFDITSDTAPDPKNRGALLVRRADLREGSLTAVPAFDDARVTRVAASREGVTPVPDTIEPTTAEPTPAAVPAPQTFTAEQVAAMLAQFAPAPTPTPPAAPEGPSVVDPTRRTPAVVMSEPLPYRFDRGGNFAPVAPGDHVFSADLHEMALARDTYGTQTDAGQRVMALLRAEFDVDSADVNELNPNIQRPDMYVDQREYRTPLWNFVNKGAPPNGIQPFTFPKFSSASGLVGDHTEGTEPTGGTFVTTSQTVTPTPLSGKAYLTRETWDMGGNPAVSTLIWNQMRRGYREGLETATGTFLDTLTAATDITLVGSDDVLAADWDSNLADLQFIRGYDFEAFALESDLYKAFVAARDADGRVLYPITAPMNANGTAQSRFRTLDLGGVTGVPSWALASYSWLFDPTTVHGWATAPQRLEFPGGSDDNATYQPVAKVGIGIWGYKAFANSDIGGVRQVTWAFS